MVSLLVITIILIILYFISRKLTEEFYKVVLLLTGSRTIAISFLTTVLFPGTVIHELSHLFTAEILGVRTGTLSLVPEIPDESGRDIQSGSVMISQTDPIRRMLIGLAPFLVGLCALSGLAWWLSQLMQPFISSLTVATIASLSFTTTQPLIALVILYLIFAISNTMFSSPEDLKGTVPVVIALVILIAAGYLTGFHISFPEAWTEKLGMLATTLIQSLILIGVVNIILAGITMLLVRTAEHITGRRLVRK